VHTVSTAGVPSSRDRPERPYHPHVASQPLHELLWVRPAPGVGDTVAPGPPERGGFSR
jgi:hypothetical protein